MQRQTGKWGAKIYTKEDQKQKYGGYFDNELDAAKKVNQLCEELGIPVKNPGISEIPNQKLKEVAEEIVFLICVQKGFPPPKQSVFQISLYKTCKNFSFFPTPKINQPTAKGAPTENRVPLRSEDRREGRKILDQNAHPWEGGLRYIQDRDKGL